MTQPLLRKGIDGKTEKDKLQLGSEYKICPLTLSEANTFVSMFHRHNKPLKVGPRFSIGLKKGEELVGVAIAGKPVARMLDNSTTIEILRVCVKEGNKNANSVLYGRIKKICQLMGFKSIITYTLNTESQSSLKAVGAVPVALQNDLRGWDRPKRHRGPQAVYNIPKIRWELAR